MNAFVSLKTHRRLKSVTHKTDTAAEDCSERAINEIEADEEGDDVDKSEREHTEIKSKRKGNSKSDNGSKMKSEGSKMDSTSMTVSKSEYELQKERNIAKNKALLATIKDPEFQEAMGELGKGAAPVKKKSKSENVKPKPEERRTSARLTAAGKKWVVHPLSSRDVLSNTNLSELTPPMDK